MVGTWAHPCLRMRCEQIVNNFSRRPYAPRPVRSRASQEVWPSLENLSTFLATGGLRRALTRFCFSFPALGVWFLRCRSVRLYFDFFSGGGLSLQMNTGLPFCRFLYV